MWSLIACSHDYEHFVVASETEFQVFGCYRFDYSPMGLREGDEFEKSLGGKLEKARPFGAVGLLYTAIDITFAAAGGKLGCSVFVWDMARLKSVQFDASSRVRSVFPRKGYVVLLLDDAAEIYKLGDLSRLMRVPTFSNEAGLCAMAWPSMKKVIACPAPGDPGQVQVLKLDAQGDIWEVSQVIRAHKDELRQICLSQDGDLLATASKRGTLIRIFNTADGSCLHELRRGALSAVIHSMAFSRSSNRLVVSSDRRSVHVFNVADAETTNKTSILRPLSGYLPEYFKSLWSFTCYQVPDGMERSMVWFGKNDERVVIVSLDGTLIDCKISPSGVMDTSAFIKLTKYPSVSTPT